MQIKCSNPVILLNPYAKYYLPLFGSYRIRGDVFTLSEAARQSFARFFPFAALSAKKNNISLQDVDTCCIFDAETGQTVPLYIVVPCGKCAICSDRKATDWAFRILCEAQYSTSVPIFITLTYRPDCLPNEGVSKDDCQRFLKRLREHCARKFQCANIRYYLCAEYTPEHKRPHYHALLFNLPPLSFPQLIGLVRQTWNLGFIKLSPITTGRITYCLKYMRKACDVPEGKNPLFYLASRRQGIGSQWLSDNIKFLRSHPNMSAVTCVDKWTHNSMTAALPVYFKQKVFPTVSGIFPKDVRDAWQELNDLYFKRTLIDEELNLPPIWTTTRTVLTLKYCCLPVYTCDRALYNKDSGICSKSLFKTQEYNNIETRIDVLECFLLDYFVDLKSLREILVANELRKNTLEAYAVTHPVTEQWIRSKEDKLKKRKQLQDASAVLR